MLSRLQAILRRFSRGSLRAHLFALVLVSVLPILIFALLVLNLFARQERTSSATGLRETSRALTSALEREFEATKTALEAVATLEELDSGDLGELNRKLRRVLQSRPNWKTIILHNPAGDQVLNLLNPFGEPLPESDIERQSFDALVKSKKPTPINLHRDGVSGATIGYRVPVMRAGELKYVLSVEMSPIVFSDILTRQKLPPRVLGMIMDARNIVVATSGAQELVGQPAGPLARHAAPGQIDGWFEGENRDGERAYAAYSRSPTTGWSVALIIPTAQLEMSLNRSVWALGGAGVIFLVAGIVGAVIVESRISDPLSDLATQAGALGRGEAVVLDDGSPITEMENLGRDIHRAGALLAERGRERDRAEGALRELNARLETRIAERTSQLEDANTELRKEIRERHSAEAALRSEHVYLNLLRSAELRTHEAASIDTTVKAAVEEICHYLDWSLGYGIISAAGAAADEQAPGRISFWYGMKDRPGMQALRETVESAAGVGRGPALDAISANGLNCVVDLAGGNESWAKAASAAGFASSCALVIKAGGRPAGALAFFSERPVQLDARVTSVLEQLAAQLGRMVERKQAEEALRLSEEQFRLAFDEGPIGICLINKDQHIMRVNRALCDLLDYNADELLGRSFSEFVAPLDRAESERRVEGLLRHERDGYAVETRLVKKDHDVLICCITAKLVAARDGTPHYALKMIEDITQRKRIEEKLRESERLAAVGATSAVFAHEIGNPLNGISTTVQVVERDLLRNHNGIKPSVLSALDEIKREITRLGALLHEFRYLARPQRLELQPITMKELVRGVLMPDSYEKRNIRVEVDIPADLPALYVDQDKIKQSILNLAENAADAMPDGGVLTLRGYRTAEDVCLDVRDTGTGIPTDVNIFELFRTTKPHGTGLGLAVVRQIISAHEGRVEYHSEPNKGTVFTIALPIRETA